MSDSTGAFVYVHTCTRPLTVHTCTYKYPSLSYVNRVVYKTNKKNSTTIKLLYATQTYTATGTVQALPQGHRVARIVPEGLV